MRTFSARETAWLQELDGIELAGFRRRAIAFLLDWTLVGLILFTVFTLGALGWYEVSRLAGHPTDVNVTFGHPSLSRPATPAAVPAEPPAPLTRPSGHIQLHREHPGESVAAELGHKGIELLADLVIPCLYFGLFLWRWNGQTPGKRLMRIRVVSLVHPHMTFWHSVERALGYGAAALEAGFGFFQFWIHPYRRCAQDRLAETIVVTERGWAAVARNVS